MAAPNGAWPVFVDVDRDTLGLSPTALRGFLARYGERRADGVNSRASGWRPACPCIPMYAHCQHDGLENSIWLEEWVVNLPSSVPEGVMWAQAQDQTAVLAETRRLELPYHRSITAYRVTRSLKVQFYTVQHASAGLGEVIAQAVNDHEEAAIVSECGAVVLIPQDEFESMRETLRLLSDPCALHALLEGHAERDAGSLTEVPSVEQVFHDLQASHS